MTNAYNVESYADHHINYCDLQVKARTCLLKYFPLTNFSSDITYYKIILAGVVLATSLFAYGSLSNQPQHLNGIN